MRVTQSNLIWFPKEDCSAEFIRGMRFSNLVQRKSFDDSEGTKYQMMRETESAYGVPISYGRSVAKTHGLHIENKGAAAQVIYEEIPMPRQGQRQFFNEICNTLQNHSVCLAVAGTGVGKTVAALNAIAKTKSRALVIVPSRSLAEQWKQEAINHLRCETGEIGILDGSSKDVGAERKIVVAVIHSLVDKPIVKDLRDSFQMVVFDECHRVPANTFSRVPYLFNPLYRLALSATPERRDGASGLALNHFGFIAEHVVYCEAEAMPVWFFPLAIDCTVKSPSWGNRTMRLSKTLSALAENATYNATLISVINHAARHGRTCLVLSDRISHLEALKAGVEVEHENTALFIGKTTKAQFAELKEKAQVIFATYGVMKEGVDIPRLDWGMDATPRVEGVQAIGRIRRRLIGKPIPIWVTPHIESNEMLNGIFHARKRDYIKCGAEQIKSLAEYKARLSR